jgi:hypothetical protein
VAFQLVRFNSLDFYNWGYMLAQLKNYKYLSLLDSKKVIQRILEVIPDDVMRFGFGWWSKPKGKGLFIENNYYFTRFLFVMIFVCHPVILLNTLIQEWRDAVYEV